MTTYYRPLTQTGAARPAQAVCLAGGWCWFTHVEVLRRSARPEILPASSLPDTARDAITAPRPAIAGICFERPRIMGILNTTPDSFSDGGRTETVEAACAAARVMAAADLIDVGGESTRPGAQVVPDEEEIRRTAPVIAALKARRIAPVISIDTRKRAVAQAAVEAGADLVNDVSGFTHDPGLAAFCASAGAPVCVMHAQGDPATMQQDPQYEDVLLDVYDFLHARIVDLQQQGIPRSAIVADPGIGFGKTLQHNLTLLANLSLFHGLGVPILLGASRKRFIGTLSGVEEASARGPGSLGVALAALQQGIQLLRVHDVRETAEAIALWRAAVAGKANE